MARNARRRLYLADAGIRVLALEGARGLTHRAVDAEAGSPRGTCSNYFPTRDDLISALVDRIGVRLAPDPETVSHRKTQSPDASLFADYLRDIVSRLKADPNLSLALFELRIEATRRPSIAETIGDWRQRAFQEDVSFNQSAKLPGGRTEIALFHYAIDGLMFDQLTVPLDTGLTVDETIDVMVSRLLP